MKVTIFHNIAEDGFERPLGMLDGYQPEHHVVPVAQYEDSARDTMDILNDAFRAFNVGGPFPDVVDEYRERGNRSLSIGDVVAIDHAAASATYWACARLGWTQINLPPKLPARQVSTWGSTPLGCEPLHLRRVGPTT